MPTEEKLKFPHIRRAGIPTPEGYTAIDSVSIEWHANLIIDANTNQYDTITIKKGDKSLTIDWKDLPRRLGLDW